MLLQVQALVLDLVQQVVMALLLQLMHLLLQEQAEVVEVIEVMTAHHLVQVQEVLQVLVEEEKVAELTALLQTEQLTLEAVVEEKDLVLSLLTL
tara:strand:- start:244 stop:525 length:282 start_codon:yes stop_codon:yes gene_type:complete